MNLHIRYHLGIFITLTVITVTFGLFSIVTAQAAAKFILINRNSSYCLAVPGGNPVSGAQLVQWRCNDLDDQSWTATATSAGTQFQNVKSGLCLSVKSGVTTEGSPVIQAPCAADANQFWTLNANGDIYQIVNAASKLCVTPFRPWPWLGGKLTLSLCNNWYDQQWIRANDGPIAKWSAKINLPIVPVAAANLASGKVLLWSARDRFNYGGDEGKTYTSIYDIWSNSSTERLVSETGHDMFCPGTSTLPDGRILVNGGSSSRATSIFDPISNTWTKADAMKVPRGYQGNTVLSNGDVFTLGGSWSGGVGNKYGEIWHATTGWRLLNGLQAENFAGTDPAGMFRSDNHMWLFSYTGGSVFHAGPAKEMHWIDTNGAGSWTNAGLRGDDAYAINGNAVMYDAGKILTVGGAPAYSAGIATRNAYAIDITGGAGGTPKVTKLKPMLFARALSSAVVLPDSKVAVFGGQNIERLFNDEGAIMTPELWDPATQSFARLPAMGVPRTYHSVAILLSDGRVFVGGGGLCGDCEFNHPDAQILSPPYLFNADGTKAVRPAIVAMSSSADAGGTFSVTTDQAISSVALIRMSAVTHAVNNDQRRITVPIVASVGNAYTLQLPSDSGVLTPGNWLVFPLNAAGVPAVARVIRIR